MIRESFSFKGAVGRRGFLVRALAIGLATFVLLFILMLGMEAVNGTVWRARLAPAPYQTGEALVVSAAVFIPYMWTSLALMAKRLRSIGLEPALFIFLFVMLGFCEPAGRYVGFMPHSWRLGFYILLTSRLMDLLSVLVLFLWPQRSSLERRATVAAAFA